MTNPRLVRGNFAQLANPATDLADSPDIVRVELENIRMQTFFGSEPQDR